MARFNEILVGRFNRALQKFTGVKGTAITPILSTEIQPVVALFRGVEDRVLEAVEVFGVSSTSAAVAAQQSQIRLRNPASSNIACVLEKLFLRSAVVQGITLGIDQTSPQVDFATTDPPINLDKRQRTTGSTLIISRQAAAAPFLGGLIGSPNMAAASNLDWLLHTGQEWVIFPGTSLILTGTVVNAAIGADVKWRERFMEQDEVSIGV